MKLILRILYLVVLLLPLSLDAQQVSIAMNGNDYLRSYPSPTFDDRFRQNSYPMISCGGGKIYAENKVKRVEVWNASNQLCYSADFDRTGRIVQSGVKTAAYFVETETFNYAPNRRATITRYFENEQLIRLDTVIQTAHRYEHLDTSFTYEKVDYHYYYSGKLLNEKNAYLNGNYRGKPEISYFSINPTGFTIDGKFDPTIVYQPPNYFDSLLRTDYDSNTFYCVQRKSDVHNVSATSNYGYDEINFDKQPKLRAHPFVKRFQIPIGTDYCIEFGSCMNEPRTWHEAMWCGSNTYGSDPEYYASTKFGYESWDDGLYASFHRDFYAEDTTKYDPPVIIPPAMDTTGSDSSKLIASISANASDILYGNPFYPRPLIRRVSTPERTLLYSFKYVFYEED